MTTPTMKRVRTRKIVAKTRIVPSRRRERSTPVPMHPQIRQIGPGLVRSAAWPSSRNWPAPMSGPNPELADMTRRFWVGLALSLPVVVLEMGGHLFNLHMLIEQKTSNWIQLLLATPVVLVGRLAVL